MTRVDFYNLETADLSQRLLFCCRLAQKAFQQGNQVYIAVNNQSEAQHLDQLLWEFQPESFLPHQINPPQASDCPIAIGLDDQCGDHHDCLINLSDRVPSGFSRFQRLAEVVCAEPSVLNHCREHFRFFRDRHYPIKTHKIA